MSKETDIIQKEYFKVLNSQHFIPEDLNYSILEKDTKLLDVLNVIENSAISIFDLYQKKHIYLSSRFETIFGFNINEAHEEGNEYFEKKVHPDDNLDAMKIGSYFLNVALSLPIEE